MSWIDANGTEWINIDGFAGAGGASEAMEEAGIPPDEAFNHSREAIAIHAANHPYCRHHCEDVNKVDISAIVGRRRVNSGWFSPDCTHHSKAKGGKPLDNKRRGLCWVIIDWIDALGVRAPVKLYLENVEEFEHYGPLDADGRPDKGRRGELFQAFVTALHERGYRRVEWKQLVAAKYGAGTSRKRLFLVARRDDRPIVWPEPSHGPGKRTFVTAADCIDWSIPCPSIFDRKKPLVDKTLCRLAKGIRRLVIDCPDPFEVPGSGSLHTNLGDAKQAMVAAFLAQHNLGAVGHDARKPLSTIVGRGTQQQLVLAHIMNLKGDGRHRDPREPLFGQCAGGNHIAEVRAFLMKYHGTGGQLQSLQRPLLTIDTEDRFGLVMVHGVEWQIVDICMRMLHWRELAAAQGFPADYQFEIPYNGKLMTKTAIVRGIGNSVSRYPARALLLANEDQAPAQRVAA